MDDEQIKMWQATHTHTQEYYPDIRMKEILQCSTICMDLQGIMLTEINQVGKNKYCVISFICGILKKNQTQKKQGVEKWLPGAGGEGCEK